MRAITFYKYGPPEVLGLEEVPRPVPRDDEVLIRIRAATVASADCELRGFSFIPWLWIPVRLMFGVFGPRRPILGQEMAGDIEAVGTDVSRFKVGDSVYAPLDRFGAHAEYVCVPAGSAMAIKPDNVSYEDAACVTAFGLNALHFIRQASIETGSKILINGAGGSIGTIAVQLAKYYGAEVTAVDSAGKLEMLRSIGADHVIDYGREDFTGSGVIYDVVLDVAGKSPYARSLASLTPTGRYVLANPRLLSMLRGLWTSARSSRKVLFEFAANKAEALVVLGDLLQAGAIKAVIDRRYALEDMVEAHRYIETGEKKGNVVVTIAPAPRISPHPVPLTETPRPRPPRRGPDEGAGRPQASG